uniref:Uncharacterized protein n=1 Tax=Anguilla anguilla TaxID=7936 RepID=A0A0E9TK87_ANGAN
MVLIGQNLLDDEPNGQTTYVNDCMNKAIKLTFAVELD